MIYLLLSAAAFICDTMIKNRIEKSEGASGRKLLHGSITIRRVYNKGAVMNTFEKYPKAVRVISAVFLIMIAFVAALAMPKKGYRLMKAGFALAFGGAACNVYDRFRRGYVVDYFSFPFLKRVIFNLSDMFILIGTVLALAGEGAETPELR